MCTLKVLGIRYKYYGRERIYNLLNYKIKRACIN